MIHNKKSPQPKNVNSRIAGKCYVVVLRQYAVDNLHAKILLHNLRQPTKQSTEEHIELGKEAGI